MMPDGPDACRRGFLLALSSSALTMLLAFWSNAATSIITDDLALRNDLQNLIAEDHQICISRHQSSRYHPSFASLRLTSRDEIFIRCEDLQPLGQNISVEPRIHQYVAKILGLAELPPETALNDQETALGKDVYLVKVSLSHYFAHSVILIAFSTIYRKPKLALNSSVTQGYLEYVAAST